MAENVFILGAGASVESGAPVMDNFLDRAEDLLRNDFFKDYSKSIKKVFKVISDLYSVYAKSYLDLNNIESLFGILEMAKIIKKLDDYSQEEISEVRNALVILIVKTLEKSIRYPKGKSTFAKPTPSYDKFVQLIKNIDKNSKDNNQENKVNNSAIITFNYDLALDVAFKLNNIESNYCLNPDSNYGVKILKLHGSINWAHCLKCDDIIPANISFNKHTLGSDYFLTCNSEKICKVNHKHDEINEVPLIVPPTWNKTSYHGKLTNVWHQAAKELGDAKNIYVFGYSLPKSDSFFRYLFALGTLGDSRIRRFWVFDPNPAVKKRYKGLIGRGISDRFDFKEEYFSSAIDLLNKELNNNNNESFGW
ncbi:SIR2 family protein [Fuchsiella alkaliacetigena]|uniref:SIR2 family protein n=1 Tax=Fuchsiella alkaliacetigena TaxID=957042 RepID=UPI00200B2112|nr:SIR2 family protein [Fuchsiella alkaliacetigena]MCK8824682.1 SIR2 family protein [Fuchsiella alkaliacetigena]